MIKANAHKYSVSAMCRVLQVNRSTYYYEAKQPPDESELAAEVKEIFRTSRNNYGTRKIKNELMKAGRQVSRRRIARIMKQQGLVSNYTTAQYKPQKDRSNESQAKNILNRQFQGWEYRDVVVSDLTYVRVGAQWNYICVLVDLYNREIIGCSAGKHKTAELVKAAFQSVEGSLKNIRLFHTDRGNEFKNQAIEELLETFGIERSLSHKGCPYDNAVAEATFKIIKTEFANNEKFTNLQELEIKLSDYVHWYNYHRVHSALGYQTPIQYRENSLKKLSKKVLTIQSKSGYRDVPLTEEAVAILKRQKEKLREIKVINMQFKEHVFLCRKGEPTKNSAYDTSFFKLCDKAGIRRFSMHVLRHMMATRCIEGGMRPKTLQVILGNANVGITMNLYVDETEEEKFKEVEKIESALKIV